MKESTSISQPCPHPWWERSSPGSPSVTLIPSSLLQSSEPIFWPANESYDLQSLVGEYVTREISKLNTRRMTQWLKTQRLLALKTRELDLKRKSSLSARLLMGSWPSVTPLVER